MYVGGFDVFDVLCVGVALWLVVSVGMHDRCCFTGKEKWIKEKNGKMVRSGGYFIREGPRCI
jgi:hypothetical protein